MLNSQTKNRIYALASIATIVFSVMSFLFVADFLMRMNNKIFNIDEKLIKEQTVVLDTEGYSLIKSKIETSR